MTLWCVKTKPYVSKVWTLHLTHCINTLFTNLTETEVHISN